MQLKCKNKNICDEVFDEVFDDIWDDVIIRTIDGEIIVIRDCAVKTDTIIDPNADYFLKDGDISILLGTADDIVYEDDGIISHMIFKTKLSKIIGRIRNSFVGAKVTKTEDVIMMEYNIGYVSIIVTMPYDLDDTACYECVDAFITCVEALI